MEIVTFKLISWFLDIVFLNQRLSAILAAAMRASRQWSNRWNEAPESVCKDLGLLVAPAGGAVVGTCQGNVAEVLDAIGSVHTIQRMI